MAIPHNPTPDVLELLRVIWALDHALQSRSKAMTRALGVTGPQRFVLRVVGRHPGISSGELAGHLHLHPSTLTGVLQRLDDRGLLRRARDPGDGRRVRLVITAKGRRVLAKKALSIEGVVRGAIGREKAGDVVTALEVLKRITSALER